ncbi:MAG: TOBE domain-containing protein, partial [Alphaproteobacteria bacterium]|nr:TOBE domain-containing protein [Alphaproteobacteria bacterium]
GSETVYEVKVGTQMLKVLRPNASRHDNDWCHDGAPVWLRWAPDAVAVLMA